MIEILIVLLVFSTAIIVGINTASKSTQYLQRLRQQTIALNIAREGIEAMYNIRDTNRRRWSSQADQCWLKVNPMVDEGNPGCENDTWISRGHRYLTDENEWDQAYFKLTFQQTEPNEKKWDSKYWVRENNLYTNLNKGNPIVYKVHNINGEWISHKEFLQLNLDEKNKENKAEWEFHRFIRIQGLYPKDGNQSLLLNCQDGEQWSCWDSSAKELRFCSTVVYTRPYQGIVNLCAIMTNFQE